MRIQYLLGCLLLVWTLSGCSDAGDKKTARVEGIFTVSDSIDATRDFSGIGLTIIQKDSSNADADTLFHQVTDSTGSLSGETSFTDRRQYPAFISRNGRNLGRIGIILADQDTVTVTGELPDLQNTLEIQSREHNAMKVYGRINRGFQRIATFAQAGRLTGDSLGTELNKWSDLFWEVYEDYDGTLASQLAASESIRLLEGWNNEAMMRKIREIDDKDELISLGATYGKKYLASDKGLDYTLTYLDSLQNKAQSDNSDMRVRMERIKLLYDSARVDQAKSQLADFQKKYEENNDAETWAEAIGYDLNYLSPGDSIPTFSFQENGRVISRDSLKGTPYILEITTLANSLYQDQYDRTIAIHSLYKNFGLQVVTLPLDNSQVTVDAFFEQRVQPWPVAPAQAFDRQELLKLFNVRVVPTRFLIDREGKIIRKYVGREYTDVIQGIQTIIKQENTAS